MICFGFLAERPSLSFFLVTSFLSCVLNLFFLSLVFHLPSRSRCLPFSCPSLSSQFVPAATHKCSRTTSSSLVSSGSFRHHFLLTRVQSRCRPVSRNNRVTTSVSRSTRTCSCCVRYASLACSCPSRNILTICTVLPPMISLSPISSLPRSTLPSHVKCTSSCTHFCFLQMFRFISSTVRVPHPTHPSYSQLS